MNLVFDKERLVLPISTDLQDVINMVIDRSKKLAPSTHAVTINFRDSSYSTESGGFTLLKSVSLGLMISGFSITSLTLVTVD